MKSIKKKAKAFAALLLAFVLAATLAACGSESSSTDAEASAASEAASENEELTVLKIGVPGSEGAYVIELAALAVENGYLEEELNAVGYTLEIYAFTSGGPEINEALASGDLDGALYGDFPAFTSKSNGIDTTVIAVLNQRMQYSLLTADEEITSAKDLEGHTVIYLQGTVTQYFWEKYAQAAGIDTDQVELVNSSDAASLLATGSADAVATTSYSAAYFEGLGLGTVLDISADYDVYTTFVATLSDSLLEEHPEVAVAMNKAFIRTYEAAVEDPQSLYDALASETLTAEYMSAAYTFDESLWYLNPEVFDETFDYYDDLNTWLYENGIIQNEVDTDSFIDTQYYYQAAQELEAQ